MEKPKYRNVNVPKETITDLLRDSVTKYRTMCNIEHTVEEKLHNIVATYIGDIYYNAFYSDLDIVLEKTESTSFKSFIDSLLAER